jgi:Phosphotransferase enzyme family
MSVGSTFLKTWWDKFLDYRVKYFKNNVPRMEALPSRDEIFLSGGRITHGVVRVGNTVRRPRNAASSAVRSLLSHLEMKGFSAAPRYVGTDGQGRDIFTYIPGAIGKWQFYPDETIRLAGRLLRTFHDATIGSNLLLGKPVMCHHDPGPNNCVFQGTRPIAFIDFDMIAPGERLEDLSYMAWSWCISAKESRQPVKTQARQVGLLATAYGIDGVERHALFESILERQTRNIQFWLGRKESSDSEADRKKIDEMVEWTRKEQAYTIANKSEFWKALA